MRGPRELVPGLHGLGTDAVNWYLVEVDGRLVAIDAGLPKFAEALDDDLRDLGFSRADVTALVLTHSDSDHTGIAPALRQAGARVLIHERDEPALRKPGPKKGDASPRHMLANMWRPEGRFILADIMRQGGLRLSKLEDSETFSDGDVLDVPGSPRVVHTPGHTPGHSALLFEDLGVLFAGDALITHEVVTKGAGIGLMPRWTNEDNVACVESLRRIEAIDAELVLVGHGEPWTEGPAAAAAQARSATQR